MIAGIAERLAEHGLLLRGGFHPAPADDVPRRRDGAATRTLLLVGDAGPAMWAHFTASPEHDLLDDPLDTWTRRVVSPIARTCGAEAWFPFAGPPHLPFQRWALRAEDVHVSPLKLLIHPEYGLWHAYRAALAFAEEVALPSRTSRASPCDGCATRACLGACPVGAHDHSGFDAARCIDHLEAPAGKACRDEGCRARLACPVGEAYRHDGARLKFHMRAFLARRRAAGR